MDMDRFVPDEAMQGVADGMTFEIEGNAWELPENLEAGQTLKDGEFTMKISSDNPAMAMAAGNWDFVITDRKVEKQEKVTTSAGTFDAYKISYTIQMEMKMMGMTRKMEVSGADWIAEGVGSVKSESYNKKGALTNYTLLVGTK